NTGTRREVPRTINFEVSNASIGHYSPAQPPTTAPRRAASGLHPNNGQIPHESKGRRNQNPPSKNPPKSSQFKPKHAPLTTPSTKSNPTAHPRISASMGCFLAC
uniref:Uncharacterized protein n=1 Tax=Aegilops tauschii subsp. strangulata TaxID=200361 RepID=A0A453CIW8_AEGTS